MLDAHRAGLLVLVQIQFNLAKVLFTCYILCYAVLRCRSLAAVEAKVGFLGLKYAYHCCCRCSPMHFQELEYCLFLKISATG